jgi:radical SAM protein with 4Fe4S-binding SPASM domain
VRGGAGRVVCLIDPVGDVYACPFAIHENFLAGNVRSLGGFQGVWRDSSLFQDLRRPQTGGACASCSFFDSCQGGCMAAKFFTGLPLDGPDPECVRGFGEQALAARSGEVAIPRSEVDHSRSAPRNSRGQDNSRTAKGPVPLALSVRPDGPVGAASQPDRACDESPLAGLALS